MVLQLLAELTKQHGLHLFDFFRIIGEVLEVCSADLAVRLNEIADVAGKVNAACRQRIKIIGHILLKRFHLEIKRVLYVLFRTV